MAIPQIESNELLQMLNVSDFPHLKPNSRKKIVENIKAHKRGGRQGALMSPQDIAKAIGAISGG
tara:strand:+ start:3576 stop:3767 length:192 start_codon:yes stop_codon:yes gene_type:complete